MEYFQILHLKKEPFSNSPDPDFFYPSRQHNGCLQKLELAIRLRRGLNVVIGDVGTGKTTLCRHLVRKFIDDKGIDIYLILDPGYTSPIEFLRTIAFEFNLIDNEDLNIWQLKEKIKNFLFNKGVDNNQIITLVFDEGQKLPNFCLEIIRELLNYETNEFKLLQIVIFAQKEFNNIIKEYDYFADRINICYQLKPLNFSDTANIIKFRLNQASQGRSAPNLFTTPALYNIYKSTKGYPRKILHLCHIVLLSLIIQNKTKVNWFLVQSCIKRDASGKFKKKKPYLLYIFILFIISGIYSEFKYNLIDLKKFDFFNNHSEIKNSNNFNFKQNINNYQNNENDDSYPIILGKINAASNETISEMIRKIYGTYTPWLFKYIQMINPNISDPNDILKDQTVNFPSVPIHSDVLKSEIWLIEIIRKTNLIEAYEYLKTYPNDAPEIELLPFWNKKEGLCFSIFLKKYFKDRASAIDYLNDIIFQFSLSGKIIGHWESDTIFFSKLFENH